MATGNQVHCSPPIPSPVKLSCLVTAAASSWMSCVVLLMSSAQQSVAAVLRLRHFQY